jgi:hypothetical protein
MPTIRIKVSDVTMAYDEPTAEIAAQRVADEYNVRVELTGEIGGGGWPTVNLTGTPTNVVTALLGAWDTGDAEENAAQVRHYLATADLV